GRMVELEDGLNRNVHLAQDDYGIIVTWMEVADNFAAIHGSSNKTKISGKPKVKKIDAFKALAKHLNLHASIQKALSANHTETGLGITSRELARGMSIPQKLEQMCPYYCRMKVLFGLKPNITPSSTVELGVPESDGSDDDEFDDFEGETGNSDERDDCQLTFAPLAQSSFVAMATPRPPDSHETRSTQTANGESSAARTCRSNELFVEEEEAASSESSTEDSQSQNASYAPMPSQSAGHAGETSTSEAKKRKTKDLHQDSKHLKKKSSTSAHDVRMSLSTAYARHTEATVNYLNNKLEEDRRQWNAKQDAEKRQREEDRRQWDAQNAAEIEQRRREYDERRSIRKHEIVLELLRQKKTEEEIESFLRLVG
ncbi:hypothetical protein F441_22694, partial [Phytophthora nicotianae CJ01A1]